MSIYLRSVTSSKRFTKSLCLILLNLCAVHGSCYLRPTLDENLATPRGLYAGIVFTPEKNVEDSEELDIRYMDEYKPSLTKLFLDSHWMDIKMDSNDSRNTGNYESKIYMRSGGVVWNFQNYSYLCSSFKHHNNTYLFRCFLKNIVKIPGCSKAEKYQNFLDVSSRFINKFFSKEYLESRHPINSQDSEAEVNRKTIEQIIEDDLFLFQFRFTVARPCEGLYNSKDVLWWRTTFVYPRGLNEEAWREELIVDIQQEAVDIILPDAISTDYKVRSYKDIMSWLMTFYKLEDGNTLITTLSWKTEDVGRIAENIFNKEMLEHIKNANEKAQKA